jgi:hypothetical protein
MVYRTAPRLSTGVGYNVRHMGARVSSLPSPTVAVALALAATFTTPARAGDPDEETPRMAAPQGQPQPDSRRWDPPTVNDHSRRRRFQLTLLPIYAAFRVPFVGRPDGAVRGGGVQLEGDFHVLDPVWLRLSLSHTAHRLNDEFARDADERIVQTAAKGTLQATAAGFGIVYGLDLGRVLPLVEVGIGGMWLRGPDAVIEGQAGGACRGDGTCDTGLSCAPVESVCRQSTILQAHGGVGVDVLLGEHFSVGASLRYFALLLTPTTFPIYLTTGARFGLRF